MIEKRRNMDIFGFDLSASDNFIIYAIYLLPVLALTLVLAYLVRKYALRKQDSATVYTAVVLFLLFTSALLVVIN